MDNIGTNDFEFDVEYYDILYPEKRESVSSAQFDIFKERVNTIINPGLLGESAKEASTHLMNHFIDTQLKGPDETVDPSLSSYSIGNISISYNHNNEVLSSFMTTTEGRLYLDMIKTATVTSWVAG